MQRKNALFLVLLFAVSSLTSWPQTSQNSRTIDPLAVRPATRITRPIDEEQRVVLTGQRHPLARAEYAIGEAQPDLRMERMVLVLTPTAEQQAALETLLQEQQDSQSPYYHKWLTPQAFGSRFGASDEDLQQLVNWLQSHGMETEEVPASRRGIVFTGTAAQVESAFHTRMQWYSVKGEAHYANATDPEIPEALAPAVSGVLSLHNFVSAPQHVVSPAFTSGGTHYLMPGDWDTIYDVNPLLSQGLTGSGESIAVLGRVDIALSDVVTFRSNGGLPANNPQIIVNGTDPGDPDFGDQVESSLDVEWAGAIGKGAVVKFITSKSGSSDGIALSAQYAVSHNSAPIVSLSYGMCEAAEGSAGNSFWNSLWQQAASQGMSVLVSSGDSGAAGCDSSSAATATQGRGVNALCTSIYSTCVGGTGFNEGSNASQYWSSTNGAALASALSYIPEVAWNESGSGGLWATGGGASIAYAKPGWQSAPGVPADGRRDVPDVAMTAAIHDSYMIQVQGSTMAVGGTSAATPSLASAMALVIQNAGSQGNMNPNLYALARLQLSSGGAAVFHDITSGNNSVPGVTGFNAGTGYDQTTGLGSIDANTLVDHWSDPKGLNFSLAASPVSLTIPQGGSGSETLTMSPVGGFSSAVTLSASGMPAGVTVKFSSATLTVSAHVTATISVPTGVAAGAATVTINGSGGGLIRSVQIPIAVTAPTFTLAASAASVTVKAGSSSAITLTTAVANGFQSAVSLSASGLPKNVTATFSKSPIASPGSGSSTLTISAASTATAGTATVTVTAAGGGITKTQTISLTTVVPSLVVSASTASPTVAIGKSTTISLSGVAQNLSSSVLLSVRGLPKGVTATFSPASIASPGSGSSTMTLTAASTATVGTSSLTITATGGGVTTTQSLSLSVTAATVGNKN